MKRVKKVNSKCVGFPGLGPPFNQKYYEEEERREVVRYIAKMIEKNLFGPTIVWKQSKKIKLISIIAHIGLKDRRKR